MKARDNLFSPTSVRPPALAPAVTPKAIFCIMKSLLFSFFVLLQLPWSALPAAEIHVAISTPHVFSLEPLEVLVFESQPAKNR